MRWTSQAAAWLVAMALAGCNGRGNQAAGTAGGAETGSMSDTTGLSDTSGMSRMPADTGRNAMPADTGMRRDSLSREGSDTSARNQTQSGNTDSTGQSTLGKGVEKTRPDQGEPVTSKGDTINPAVDSTR
jgi:hypothetical protein